MAISWCVEDSRGRGDIFKALAFALAISLDSLALDGRAIITNLMCSLQVWSSYAEDRPFLSRP